MCFFLAQRSSTSLRFSLVCRLVISSTVGLRLGSVLIIAGERAQAVIATSFLDSGLIGGLLGHRCGGSLCNSGWLVGLCGDSICLVLRLVSVEALHVIVKLLLTRLLEPDRFLGFTKSLPFVSDQLGEVG